MSSFAFINCFGVSYLYLKPFFLNILRGLTGSGLDHISLQPEFESRREHIWRLFHLWLRFIPFGCRSAYFAFLVHKGGRKPSIVVILNIHIRHLSRNNLFCQSSQRWSADGQLLTGGSLADFVGDDGRYRDKYFWSSCSTLVKCFVVGLDGTHRFVCLFWNCLTHFPVVLALIARFHRKFTQISLRHGSTISVK